MTADPARIAPTCRRTVETRSLRAGDRPCGLCHIESRLGAARRHRGSPARSEDGSDRPNEVSMSLPGGDVMANTADSVVEDATAPREPMAGRSPMRIAMGRLRQDNVAMVCLAIVLIFVLIAIFAGVLADMFNVEPWRPGNPAQQLDFLGDGMPLNGPPNYGFDSEHPFGVAPKTAVDNLAYWLYGCRTSLTIASTATLFATLIGVVIGPGRRVRRRRGRQGHLVRHRPLPDAAVPAHGPGDRADHQLPLRRRPELPHAPEVEPGRHPGDLRLDGRVPPGPRRDAVAARARVRPGGPRDRDARPAASCSRSCCPTWSPRSWSRSR